MDADRPVADAEVNEIVAPLHLVAGVQISRRRTLKVTHTIMEDTHGNEIVKDHGKKQEWQTCRHNTHPHTRPHVCPLQAEGNDNFADYCICCTSCTHNCADDL